MRAGRLRHTIAIQAQTETTDGLDAGGIVAWATVTGMGSVPAEIMPTRADEIVNAGKLELDVTHKITIRYRSGITAKHRILFGSRTFNIVSLVKVSERNIMLEILAMEQT